MGVLTLGRDTDSQLNNFDCERRWTIDTFATRLTATTMQTVVVPFGMTTVYLSFEKPTWFGIGSVVLPGAGNVSTEDGGDVLTEDGDNVLTEGAGIFAVPGMIAELVPVQRVYTVTQGQTLAFISRFDGDMSAAFYQRNNLFQPTT